MVVQWRAAPLSLVFTAKAAPVRSSVLVEPAQQSAAASNSVGPPVKAG
jgi:hypothetical protein